MTPLESLAKVLASPKDSTALRAAIEANPVTCSFDRNHPDLVIQADARTQTKVYGRLDDDGNLHPLSETEWKALQARPRA